MSNDRTFPRDLPHPLSDDEVLDRFHKAQALDERADELEMKLKDDTKERRDAIKRTRVEAKGLRTVAHKREEHRSVLCREELRGSQVFTLRVDTGAVVDQRAATADDQQETFPGLGAADDPPLPADYSPTGADKPTEEPAAPKGKGGKGKKGARR